MANKLTSNQGITTGLTAQHIATNLANYESARSSFFMLEVSDLSNLLKTNYTGELDAATPEDFYVADSAQEYLRLNVTKCDVPHYEVTTHEFRRGNDVVHFAGVPTFNGGSITVDDLVGIDTKSILMSWLRLAYDPHTFKGGRMKDYKKTCTLVEYTQDFEEIRSWTLYGVFVTGLSEDSFDKESDNKRSISVSFKYDRAIMNLPEIE